MIIIKAKHAKTFWQKSKGLLGKQKIEPLFLQTRWGIHTFGMQEAIDVIILNKQQVVAMKANMSPNSIFVWNPKHHDVLELPPGSIKKLQVTLHQQIRIRAIELL